VVLVLGFSLLVIVSLRLWSVLSNLSVFSNLVKSRIALGLYHCAIREFDNGGACLYCGRSDDLRWVACVIFAI
jgi:hypothetical protein